MIPFSQGHLWLNDKLKTYLFYYKFHDHLNINIKIQIFILQDFRTTKRAWKETWINCDK